MHQGLRRAAVAIPIALALGAGSAAPVMAAPAAQTFAAPLSDLLATSGPLDGASARLIMTSHDGSTTFVLIVTGIDPAAAANTYGAHLHVGPCIAGSGAAAGPHYNSTGQPPTVVSDQTEVWLDFTVNTGGSGQSVTQVPWVPQAGAHSVVVHELPTASNGTAGARLACLPVEW